MTKPAIPVLLERAAGQLQAGFSDQAEQLYLSVLALDANCSGAHCGLGDVALKKDQIQQALSRYMKALETDPACAKYWLNYAGGLELAGQPEAAREVLEMARQQGVKLASLDGVRPRQSEVDVLIASFNRGDLARALSLSEAMTAHYPGYALGWTVLGAALRQSGRILDAVEAMQKAAALETGDAAVHSNLGIALYESGNFDAAEASCRRAIGIKFDFAQAHNNLGIVLHSQGRLDEAQASYRQALAVLPLYAEAWSNLGITLHDLKKLDEAEQAYRQALNIRADYAEAHCNLGIVLHETQRLVEAEAAFRVAMQINPNYAEPYYNLSLVLEDAGRYDEIEQCLLKALQIKPDYAEGHNKLGNFYQREQRLVEAEASYREAIRLKPDYAEAHGNLGNALFGLRSFEESVFSHLKAIDLNPDFFEAHNNLGITLMELGLYQDAEASCRRALKIRPDLAEAHNNLAQVLQASGGRDEAEVSFRRALEIRPDFAQVHNNLGGLLLKFGEFDKAEACFRDALRCKPDYAMAHSNLIFVLDLNVDEDTASLQTERRRWDELHGTRYYPKVPHENVPDPQRKLRVGYVSADFKEHSAPKVFGSMLTRYDRAQFDVFVYSNFKGRDDRMARLFRDNVTGWRAVAGMSDDALAALIREDAIDILVDLSGHSAGNRLQAFARKPAPIQITAWGYASATGLRAMDVFFADPVVVPTHERAHFVESVIDLPCVVGSFSVDTFPEVNELPALSEGCVTFGSFNRLTKISEESYRLWCRLLHELPGSRLLMKTPELSDPAMAALTLETFVSAGIAADRIVMLGKSSWFEHMSAYRSVDIALDPFPHGGGVTTQESLMMGVPVVTLCWPTMAGRVTSSIMMNLGLSDWVADTMDEYVELAKAKASDLKALSALRVELPARYTSSVMGDPAAYTVAVEREYRNLWSVWCAKSRGG